MAYEALKEDTVFMGTIYLKGETQYPEEMATALGEKKVPTANADAPIFTGGSVNPPTQTVVDEEVPPVPGQTVITDDQVPAGETPLPSDFPHREQFIEAGFFTVESVRSLPSLTEVDGVGPARAAEVQEYLQDN